jgi:hypothetical protein
MRNLVVKTVDNPSDRKTLINILKPVLGAKQFGHEDLLAPLVADASISVLGKGKVMKVANVETNRRNIARLDCGARRCHYPQYNGVREARCKRQDCCVRPGC